MSQRTAIFSKLVKDGPVEPPLTVTPGSCLKAVVEAMRAQKAACVIVVNARGGAEGIITEQDITRRVIFRMDETSPVTEVMSSPVISLQESEYLYYAIARMRRHGFRHMPVVNAAGKVTGTLSLANTIAAASAQVMNEIDLLTREDTIQGQAEIKQAQVSLAAQMMSENIPATDIMGLITRINNDIYRRIVNLNLTAMVTEGFGPPPVGFSVIVMGSGGRSENYLYPDQDNGFILDDYPDARHQEIDPWFIELAERMTRDLDAVGLPLCKGFVMANNPLWRKSLSQWKHQLEIWNQRPNTTRLRLCDIFFDFRTVWGSEQGADELRRHVTRIAGNNPAFLRAMYEDDQDHGTALGWFGRFITVKKADEPAYEGYLNLKHSGSLPLVEAMRLLALREGITKISTLDRMAALHESGGLSADEYDYLSAAFRHIAHLLLRQQLTDFKQQKRVGYFIHPDHLSAREKDMLVSSLQAIDQLRKRIRSEFTGDIF
ncbi:MAG: CBS domain-containing protein [Rhodospirillales bacterium]|nr:CBS domain-containing protein [Rhodospirillales bacterium]